MWNSSDSGYPGLILTFKRNASPLYELLAFGLQYIKEVFIFYHLNFFFFWRKISPELTAANPPLFAEKGWPWANICAHLPLLYMWDTCHSMTWQTVHRSAPGIPTGEPGAAQAECANLTTAPLGRSPSDTFF